MKNNKLKEEFIEKISSTYSSLSGDVNNQNDIKVLWRWVKDLIDNKKNLISPDNIKGNIINLNNNKVRQ